jgi:hypothetical protein
MAAPKARSAAICTAPAWAEKKAADCAAGWNSAMTVDVAVVFDGAVNGDATFVLVIDDARPRRRKASTTQASMTPGDISSASSTTGWRPRPPRRQ